MKSKFTKITGLLLACLFVFCVAVGCSDGTGNDTTTGTQSAPETTGETVTTAEETTGTVTETDPETTGEATTAETTEEATTEETTTEEITTEGVTTTEVTTEEETTAHTHSFGEWTVAKQPTCTEKGSEERRCSGCDELETRDIAATGHKFGAWTVTKKATCTDKGTEERTCSACGEKETRSIAATGHKTVTDKAVEATCTKDGKTEGSHCSVCGAVIKAQTTIKAKGHSYNGGWIVTKEATSSQDGTETRTCSVCGEKETRTLKYSGQKTAAPEVLGSSALGGGRVVIYGSTEPGSTIRTVAGDSVMTNRSKDKYFYIEVGAGSSTPVQIYATAPGKAESDAVQTTVSSDGGSGSVWGGRDSRLFYMPTLHFLINARAEQSGTSINQIVNYITNKTIKDIQSLTGKETKLIYVVIPDPATAYYQEHFPYVQNSVQDPSTSLMEAFLTAVNGKHKDVYGIDLMPTMRAHKDEFIYFSTDTHYTELGAYYAYLEIMKTVKKDYPNATVRTVQNGDYNIVYRDVPGGDMCGMAGLGMNEIVPFFEANFSETGSYYLSKRKDGIKSAGFGPGGWERNSSISGSNNPTAYFLGDSYGCYILPFLGANFSKMWTNEGVLWNYKIDKNILSQNKPDYVILLVCQRNIGENFMGNVISEFSMSMS